MGFAGGASGKESAYHAGDVRDAGSNPWLGRSPGIGNGNLLQKIPVTEEPNKLQSMGAQRVEHN